MPGTPKAHELEARVEAQGGWESVFDAIADGATMASLARKYLVSRSFFHRVMVKDPARRTLAQDAYTLRAEQRMDEALEIADAGGITPGQVQRDKLRIELRQWLAAADNSRYRSKNGPTVEVNIGQLHLDALRHREIANTPVMLALPAGTESGSSGDTH